MNARVKLFWLCLPLVSLAACGGGGGGGSSSGGGGGTTTNSAPVANAGADQTAGIGFEVSISGSASSDANGDTLTYSWTIDSAPAGSTASLSNAATVTTEITPDVLGDYVISLVVNDGTADSNANEITITVVDGADSLGLTDIVLREAGSPLTADFYAPKAILDRLADERTVTWTESVDLPGNLTRFSFGDDATTDIFIVTDTTTSVDAPLSVSAALASDSSVTTDLLLSSMFKFVEVDTGEYAIYSSKHSNYALDVADDGISLILRDVRSLQAYENETSAFLTFAVAVSPLTLVANNHYTMDASASVGNATQTFVADAGWIDQEVALNGTSLELVATGGATMKLYEAPIQLNIPFDFNPEGTPRVSNAEYFAPNVAGNDEFVSGINGIDSAYASQVTIAGSDTGTRAAAESMLDAIETALASQGSQMRYPAEFYLTVREGLFERVTQFAQSMDGELGQLTVPYVYFTNETDTNGDYHPFMVVASRGMPDTLSLLGDVPHPPGDGLSGGYNDQKVTRSFFRKNFLLKFPLRDYGEVATLTENDLSAIGSLASDVGTVDYDHHNYADTGNSAMGIDGVLIFPAYNNQLHFSQEEGELSTRGWHAGRGLDVHYHADPHSAAFTDSATDTGLSLYNAEDYGGHTHPPIISLGMDGVAGYGFYLDGDSSSDGVDVVLDEFGGHEHDDYGYHYHSLRTVRQTTSTSTDYTTHELGPLGAWSGRINYVPEFQSRDARNIWLGNP